MRSKLSAKVLLGLISAVTIFHLCVITQIIPYTIVWGGLLKNEREMYIFEFFSILFNLFFGFIVLMKGGFIKHYFRKNVIDIVLWLFICLFILNTIGNLCATTALEKMFSVLTLILAFLTWTLIRTEK